MEKITFVIPSKNNLRYLKWCIPSIRKNAYREDHDIIVFVDKDEDGTLTWLEENKNKYDFRIIINPDLNESLFGIGKAYDKGIAESETDIFCIFHADMYLGKNADFYMYEKLERGKVVCATRIEPPLHPEEPSKVVKDFGMWPEHDVEDGFKEDELNDFIEELKENNDGRTTEGCFAPWMMYKEDFLEIGGHDFKLKSAREDSDVFNRMVLNRYDLIQSWEAYVYHLTCRGGQFEHGKLTTDNSQKSKEWQILMNNSTREFIRKWGSQVKHDEYMKPIIPHKYDMGLKLMGFPDQRVLYTFLYELEPFFNNVYVDDEEVKNKYINEIQLQTEYNLGQRVLFSEDAPENDMVVSIDIRKVSSVEQVKELMFYLKSLPDILDNNDIEEGEEFKLNLINIYIHRIRHYETNLIKNKDNHILNGE